MDQNQELEIDLGEAFKRNPWSCLSRLEKIDDIKSLDFRVRIFRLPVGLLVNCKADKCGKLAGYVMTVVDAGHSSPWMCIICHDHLGTVDHLITQPFHIH